MVRSMIRRTGCCCGQVLLAFFLSIVPATSGARDSDSICSEVTSLWMPSDAGIAKVIKWEQPVEYTIVAANPSVERSVKDVIQLASKNSGLKMAPSSGPGINLFIAIVPEIAIFATPAGRKSIESYFMDFYREKGIPAVASEINLTAWQGFRDATPRCLGITFTVGNGHIERAFLAVQENETPACIEVGLGEQLGLVNIRKDYLERGRDLSVNRLSVALRTLYDAKVRAGMSKSDAAGLIDEACK
jgi:hypothetical protein